MTNTRTIRTALHVALAALGYGLATTQFSPAHAQQPPPHMMGPGAMGPGMYADDMPGMMGYGGMGPGMMMGPGMHGGMMPGMMGHGMYGGGMGPGMMGYGGMGPGMMMGFGPAVDARFGYLKAQLGITDTQKDAWEGFVKAAKARFDAMQTMHSAMYAAWQKGTLAARLEARISGMEAMLQNLKAQKSAVETLYKALSDDQKKKADYWLGSGWGMM